LTAPNSKTLIKDTLKDRSAMSPISRLLGPGDDSVLDNVAPSVFDNAIDPRWTAEFLSDPRHHLTVAIDEGWVVGMASAIHHVHPDRGPYLWISEIAVAPPYQERGIGRRLTERLLDRGRELGCRAVHVGTERSNTAARRLYAAVGGVESPEDSVEFVIDLGEAK
jgi:aminoglycoside 6'-N-acetyltransferase I